MKRPSSIEERKLYRSGYQYIAGADEAGRGSWAGPIVAAAVILPSGHRIRRINDSKKLSPEVRENVYVDIVKLAVSWAVAIVDNRSIDRKGITRVNSEVLREAINRLHIKPDFALIDAVNIDIRLVPTRPIINGDEKVISIAAASIIAKVTRDRIMIGHHRLFPQYEFLHHKGYGTEKHRRLLKKYGLSFLHRQSFLPMKKYIRCG